MTEHDAICLRLALAACERLQGAIDRAELQCLTEKRLRQATRRRADCSGGWYEYVTTDQYVASDPMSRLIQTMIVDT